jgi:hypothetical protein
LPVSADAPKAFKWDLYHKHFDQFAPQIKSYCVSKGFSDITEDCLKKIKIAPKKRSGIQAMSSSGELAGSDCQIIPDHGGGQLVNEVPETICNFIGGVGGAVTTVWDAISSLF